MPTITLTNLSFSIYIFSKIFASTEKSGIFAPPLKNKANEGELVAQLVEHIPFKDGVLGSSPNWLTKAIKVSWSLFFVIFRRNIPFSFYSSSHPPLILPPSSVFCRFLFLNLSPKYGLR